MKIKKKKIYTGGLFILGLFFLAVCLIYTVRLVNMQITGVDKYSSSSAKTFTRYETVQAVRGEIYDCNGKPLVTNEYTNTIQLSYNSLKYVTSNGKNSIIASLYDVLEDYGEEFTTRFPVKGTYPHVQYDDEKLENTVTKNRFYAFLEKNKLPQDIPCVTLFEWLLEHYGIKTDGIYKYEGKTQYSVIAVRYEMDTMNFAPDNPFIVKERSDIKLVTAVLERAQSGIYIKKEWSRVYNYPGHASHILGRVGKIPQNDIDEYLANGYPYDAVVGLDGAEKAFEHLLKGADGVVCITEDEYGNILSTETDKEAVPGRNVYLTVDIDLQMKVEALLEENIRLVVENSTSENDGGKADSGAVSVVDPDTGMIKALASYPSFDLSTFTENYETLSTDAKRPLFNRALLGNYAPGSTFKVATSAAALTHGIITEHSDVYCSGKYTFYSDYQPRCWYRYGHGELSVIDALGYSCNCFFFDVGRRLGVELLNDYCSTLGLGQYTGVELAESKGVIAGPIYYSEQNLGAWNPGDTLQASIGQSGNAVTPLQLSMYISTVLNSGTRYKATVLYKTETFSGEDVVYNEPVVLSQAELSDAHTAIIKAGMKRSKETTSATKRYKFDIGSKTGTAQITSTDSNGVLTAFAPYKDPQMVVSCVIENGAGGSNAAHTVLGTISAYFNLDASGVPLPDETEAPETQKPQEETKRPNTTQAPVENTTSDQASDTLQDSPSEDTQNSQTIQETDTAQPEETQADNTPAAEVATPPPEDHYLPDEDG